MSADIMKSKFVRHLSVSQLSLNLMHGFLSHLAMVSPGQYARTSFEFLNIFSFVLRIFFVNMGPYGSENFKTLLLLQIAAKVFTLLLNTPSNGPHKPTFGIFENWPCNIQVHFEVTRCTFDFS